MNAQFGKSQYKLYISRLYMPLRHRIKRTVLRYLNNLIVFPNLSFAGLNILFKVHYASLSYQALVVKTMYT